MSSIKKRISSYCEKIVFIATNMEAIESLIENNMVHHGIFLNGSKKLKKKLKKKCYIHSVVSNDRVGSLSQITDVIKPIIESKISIGIKYIWSFRPYEWMDQVKVLGIECICYDFYKYQYWSNKITQEFLIKNHGSHYLSNHIDWKQKRLDRKNVFDVSEVNSVNKIIFISESTSGQGVYIDKSKINKNDSFIYRVENKVWPHIAISQVAVSDAEKTIVYQPSIMVIREREGHLDYIGSDFFINEYISKKQINLVSKLTREAGELLKKFGFLGIYNCDYIIDCYNGEVIFSEINLRHSACSSSIDKSLYPLAIECAPIILDMLIKIEGSIPPEVSQEKITKKWTASKKYSFIYIKHPVRTELMHVKIYQSESSLNNGDLVAIKSFDHPVIMTPSVPVSLFPPLEKYYL